MSAASILLITAMWCGACSSVVVPNVNATDYTGTAVTDDSAPPEVLGNVGTGTATESSAPPTIVVYNSSSGGGEDNRDSRFLSFSLGSDSAAATNSLQEKQDEAASDPSVHLVDIYTDCLMQLSFPCVQRKLLLFLDKLGRMKGIYHITIRIATAALLDQARTYAGCPVGGGKGEFRI